MQQDLFSMWCCVLVTQSCPTLADPIDCSPPGSCVHEIFQARILEWVAISFSRGSSDIVQYSTNFSIEILMMSKNLKGELIK